jgi:peptide/nickel transport system permease protein
VTGLLLLFFAQSVAPLFPIGGRTSIIHDDLNWFGKLVDVGWHLILRPWPSASPALPATAHCPRPAARRAAAKLHSDARAKGLSENRVVYIHALRNAITR